jgi:hypothetical protein
MSNTMNVIQGLKTIARMIDLRTYGAQAENGVVFDHRIKDIHDIIMNACEELAQAGEGRTAAHVLKLYIDKATKI